MMDHVLRSRPSPTAVLPEAPAAHASLAVAALALAGLVLALLIAREWSVEPAPGRLEAAATLQGPGGTGVGFADVYATGPRRVVAFDAVDLPALPAGQAYELWFVAASDRPGAASRISAGTFRPDERRQSSVELTAAADPAGYSRLAITAEPGDGDPAPAGRDLLSGPIRLR